MKADLEPAVGDPAVDLVLAFDPHLALQPSAAVMNDGAGAALAGLAMTDIDAVRLSRRDRPQLSAMTFRHPLHLVLPNVRFPILALATGGVERRLEAKPGDGVQTKGAFVGSYEFTTTGPKPRSAASLVEGPPA